MRLDNDVEYLPDFRYGELEIHYYNVATDNWFYSEPLYTTDTELRDFYYSSALKPKRTMRLVRRSPEGLQILAMVHASV